MPEKVGNNGLHFQLIKAERWHPEVQSASQHTTFHKLSISSSWFFSSPPPPPVFIQPLILFFSFCLLWNKKKSKVTAFWTVCMGIVDTENLRLCWFIFHDETSFVLFPDGVNVSSGLTLAAQVSSWNSIEETSQEPAITIARFDLQNQVNQSLLDFQMGFVRKLAEYYVGTGKGRFCFAYWSGSTNPMQDWCFTLGFSLPAFPQI